jgi:hypothetical protein
MAVHHFLADIPIVRILRERFRIVEVSRAEHAFGDGICMSLESGAAPAGSGAPCFFIVPRWL